MKMSLQNYFGRAILVLALVAPSSLIAEVQTFGGEEEQFIGDGDLVPPECNIDVPQVASGSFFVKWDCSDNNSPKDDLRSELWIKPKGEAISRKVKDFLGFPASVQVDQGLLESLSETKQTSTTESGLSFEDYLPLELRLIVRDRGGASTISKVFSVLPGSSLSCEVAFKTLSIEASGDSTGVPSLSASASSVDGANSGGGLQSLNEFSFSTCEIDELCSGDNTYSFSVSESGALSLISGNKTYGGTGELSSSDSSTISYSGSLLTNESGDLEVSISCQ